MRRREGAESVRRTGLDWSTRTTCPLVEENCSWFVYFFWPTKVFDSDSSLICFGDEVAETFFFLPENSSGKLNVALWEM